LNEGGTETGVAEQGEERERELDDPESAELAGPEQTRQVNVSYEDRKLLEDGSTGQQGNTQPGTTAKRRLIGHVGAVPVFSLRRQLAAARAVRLV